MIYKIFVKILNQIVCARCKGFLILHTGLNPGGRYFEIRCDKYNITIIRENELEII